MRDHLDVRIVDDVDLVETCAATLASRALDLLKSEIENAISAYRTRGILLHDGTELVDGVRKTLSEALVHKFEPADIERMRECCWARVRKAMITDLDARIEALEVRPGDVVAVLVRRPLSAQSAASIKAMVENAVAELAGVRVLVLDDQAQVSVLRAAEADQ